MTTTAAKGEAIPPCPWCSGSARLHECNDGHYVRCDVCDMSSGVFSRDDAIQAWSRRDPENEAERAVGAWCYERMAYLIDLGAKIGTPECSELTYLIQIISDVEEYNAPGNLVMPAHEVFSRPAYTDAQLEAGWRAMCVAMGDDPDREGRGVVLTAYLKGLRAAIKAMGVAA